MTSITASNRIYKTRKNRYHSRAIVINISDKYNNHNRSQSTITTIIQESFQRNFFLKIPKASKKAPPTESILLISVAASGSSMLSPKGG